MTSSHMSTRINSRFYTVVLHVSFKVLCRRDSLKGNLAWVQVRDFHNKQDSSDCRKLGSLVVQILCHSQVKSLLWSYGAPFLLTRSSQCWVTLCVLLQRSSQCREDPLPKALSLLLSLLPST